MNSDASICKTGFDGILTYDNNMHIESISNAKKMIVRYCVSTINTLKPNENGFRCQLWNQIKSYLKQYCLKLPLILFYRHELVYTSVEAIVESIRSDWDEIYDDSQTVKSLSRDINYHYLHQLTKEKFLFNKLH